MSVFETTFGEILSRLPLSDDAWIVGFSGGLDSSVLLHLCHKHLQQQGEPAPALVAAHVNHGLRESADADETFCRKTCETLGIPFESRRIDVQQLADSGKIGVEEAGRLARHRFFAEIGRKHATSLVFLAHHADDQLETVILNLQRGAHLRGLSGMKEVSEMRVEQQTLTLLRPLLSIAKADLAEYALQNKLAWKEDETNRDTRFRRNHVRHVLLPAIRESVPELPQALLSLSAEAEAADAILSRTAERLAAECVKPEGEGFILHCGIDTPARHPAFLYLIRDIIEEKLGGDVTNHALTTVQRMVAARTPGAVLQLPGGIRVRRETDGLYFYHDDNTLADGDEVILPSPPFRVRALGVTVEATFHAPPAALPEKDRTDGMTEWLDADALQRPLSLRLRRDGDRFRPLGAPGGKKIKDILIDRKIPQRQKERVRVLADYSGIAWLWPVCAAHRTRLKPSTKSALRVRILPDTPDS